MQVIKHSDTRIQPVFPPAPVFHLPLGPVGGMSSFIRTRADSGLRSEITLMRVGLHLQCQSYLRIKDSV